MFHTISFRPGWLEGGYYQWGSRRLSLVAHGAPDRGLGDKLEECSPCLRPNSSRAQTSTLNRWLGSGNSGIPSDTGKEKATCFDSVSLPCQQPSLPPGSLRRTSAAPGQSQAVVRQKGTEKGNRGRGPPNHATGPAKDANAGQRGPLQYSRCRPINDRMNWMAVLAGLQLVDLVRCPQPSSNDRHPRPKSR
jgi:hypothetical protein